jgi:hypothetical protein
MLSLSKAIQRAGMHVGKDDKPATAAEGLAFSSRFNSIGTDYFAAMGIPLLRGRNFTAAEATQSNSPAVAIIDEALAQKLWPEGDALGQRIQYAPDAVPRAKRDDGGGGTWHPSERQRQHQSRRPDRDRWNRGKRARRHIREETARRSLSSIRARLPEQRLLLHSVCVA